MLTDNAIQIQTYLEQLKASSIKDQNKAFQKLGKELRGSLVDFDGGMTLEKLKALQSEISKLMNATLESMSVQLFDTLEELSADAAMWESASIESVLAPAVANDVFKTVDVKALWSKARNTPLGVKGYTGDLLLKSFIDGWIKPEIRRVNNTILNAYYSGQTNKQLIDAVLGSPAARHLDGDITKVARAAETISRTAIQHVAATSQHEVWKANKGMFKGYRWVSTLDSRTSSQCRSLDGEVFDFGKGPMPPIHCRCRSTTVGALADKYSWLSEGATRSSKGGYVKADLKYYQWLKNQPASFVDEVLGVARGQLFRKGGISAERFTALQLDKNFRPRTLEELRGLIPEAFKQAEI